MPRERRKSVACRLRFPEAQLTLTDRKSTRLNSSHII